MKHGQPSPSASVSNSACLILAPPFIFLSLAPWVRVKILRLQHQHQIRLASYLAPPSIFLSLAPWVRAPPKKKEEKAQTSLLVCMRLVVYVKGFLFFWSACEATWSNWPPAGGRQKSNMLWDVYAEIFSTDPKSQVSPPPVRAWSGRLCLFFFLFGGGLAPMEVLKMKQAEFDTDAEGEG